jgi:hypothetical protein
LSFIYQALGCVHSLQPPAAGTEKVCFIQPSIPALTPAGFERWQTIQLLLDPDEHVPYLQEAIKIFDVKNETTGAPFPKLLPREAFPAEPNAKMVRWHDEVFVKLRGQAQDEDEGGAQGHGQSHNPRDRDDSGFGDEEPQGVHHAHSTRAQRYDSQPSNPNYLSPNGPKVVYVSPGVSPSDTPSDWRARATRAFRNIRPHRRSFPNEYDRGPGPRWVPATAQARRRASHSPGLYSDSEESSDSDGGSQHIRRADPRRRPRVSVPLQSHQSERENMHRNHSDGYTGRNSRDRDEAHRYHSPAADPFRQAYPVPQFYRAAGADIPQSNMEPMAAYPSHSYAQSAGVQWGPSDGDGVYHIRVPESGQSMRRPSLPPGAVGLESTGRGRQDARSRSRSRSRARATSHEHSESPLGRRGVNGRRYPSDGMVW